MPVQCWDCSCHSIELSPTSFLDTFSCRDFSCRCCSLLTRIHPCSMSDTVYQEEEAGEQLGPEPPEIPHSHSSCAVPLLSRLGRTNPHLCVQQV